MQGVSALDNNVCWLAVGNVVNGGTVAAYWDNGRPLAVHGVVQGRKGVDLNVLLLSYPATWTGDIITLLKNALLYQ